jgi:hypothetical protein
MNNTPQHAWQNIFNITVLSAYFYAFMEWLFFATKPSSLSILTLFEKLQVFFITGGFVALISLAGMIVLNIPALLAKNQRWIILRFIPAAFILSIATLILFDNFTYTVFEFGVISTDGIFRVIYALGFLIIFRRMIRFVRHTNIKLWKYASFLTVSLLAVSIAGILAENLSNTPYSDSDTSSASRLPNIIVLGGDGLSANYMSAYGYGQETTPFLAQLAKTSLVAENAINNASSTTGSTTSMLTGKEPINVNVLRYPDILSGNDSFEHLPGILRQQGYKTVEIGVPYFVDAQKLNLLDGFEFVNNRSLNLPASDLLRNVLGNSPSNYFIQTIFERAGERLLHIYFIREMQSPLAGINSPKSRMSDDERVEQIIQLMDDADRPLFIFAHFMDTHGPEFSSQFKVFSSGPLEDKKKWSERHYKDALLSYDANVKKIHDYLELSGQLNNTILVIYTDHGYGYTMNQRIPILIHFPHDVPAGKRSANVQIMDIPVTLLDYLETPRPEWMAGTSMLGDEPPVNREIFSIKTGSPKKSGPPFYQIKIVQLTVCQNWYALNVQENTWISGTVTRHTARCESELLPTDEEARQRILDYLQEFNYNISILQDGNELHEK